MPANDSPDRPDSPAAGGDHPSDASTAAPNEHQQPAGAGSGDEPSGGYHALRPGDPGYPSAPVPATASYPPQPPTDSRSTTGYRPPAPSNYGQSGYPASYGNGGFQPGYGNGGFQSGYGSGAPQAHSGYQPTSNYPQPTAPYGQADWTGQQPADPAAEPGPVKPSRKPLVGLALVAALVGGGVGGGIVALADHNGNKTTNSGIKITNSTAVPPAKLDGSVSAAATKIRPSVVTINVTGSQEAATGSGVIIKDNGTILTNDHVVDISGGQIQVVLSDGRTAAAKILGRDTSDDLAVIKVDGLANLTAATFAKSETLTVGQPVVAVGAPLGLSDTVTSGIISNTARPVRAGDNDQAVFDAVQTDAAINPGNSGGPLVDLSGSVVGINAAIASDQSGGGLQIPGQQAQQSLNIGIGFAIPADEASRIAGELMINGKATHAVLGVTVKTSSTGTTGNTVTAGVPLNEVTAGGVADKAGLKAGDLVTQIDSQRVTTADALIAAVRSHAPGEKVKVSYTRNGQASSVDVTLGSSDS